MSATQRLWLAACGGVTVLLLALVYAALVYAPTEAQMGPAQRLFYFHVPSAASAGLGFVLVFVGSVQYLRTRNPLWDRLALAGAELGVLFALIVLITGPLWARPVWGVFWKWEPRLTSMLVLFSMYVAYLMLRRYSAVAGRTPRLAAVVGIVAFANVPLVYYSVRLWAEYQQLHPRQVTLAPEMRLTLAVGMVTMLGVFGLLLWLRWQVARTAARVQALQEARHASR